MGVHRALLCLVLLLCAASASAQTAGQQQSQPASQAQNCQQKSSPCEASGKGKQPDATGKHKQQNQSSEERQTTRIMWVVPNFAAVSAGKQMPPLSAHDKFVLASHDCLDYTGFTWTAILAAQTYALNSDPELGRGGVAYLRYFWRTFADGVSGSYFTEAIVPSITHEDPRYYTLGHGGFFRRTGYALSRAVLTKTDSGGTSFNWSEVGGNALVAALSNAYYPPQERGLPQTFRDWGGQMESAVLNNIVKEFWPDIRHKILRQK